MKKMIFILSLLFSLNAFSQSAEKPDPNSSINAEEQIHSLPGKGVGTTFSVRTKRKGPQAPPLITPVENTSPANCADSLGTKGSANFTACEANKKTR